MVWWVCLQFVGYEFTECMQKDILKNASCKVKKVGFMNLNTVHIVNRYTPRTG